MTSYLKAGLQVTPIARQGRTHAATTWTAVAAHKAPPGQQQQHITHDPVWLALCAVVFALMSPPALLHSHTLHVAAHTQSVAPGTGPGPLSLSCTPRPHGAAHVSQPRSCGARQPRSQPPQRGCCKQQASSTARQLKHPLARQCTMQDCEHLKRVCTVLSCMHATTQFCSYTATPADSNFHAGQRTCEPC